jgi:hypothetical protein
MIKKIASLLIRAAVIPGKKNYWAKSLKKKS